MPSSRRCPEALALLALLACRAPDDSAPPGHSAAPVDSEARVGGVIVLAGGGSEGELDDLEAWSARLYGALLSGGDISGDGLLRVAVLSADEETDWIPRYFERLGADEAFNLRAGTRRAAQEAAAELEQVDVIFIKGGDQGVYYDLWNDNALDEAIWDLHARGGGVGGTSAGAMALAGLALAGGRDLVSADLLADAHSPYLDDTDGGSALHADFIGLVPGALIDTHFTQRARLGRLAGAMARALDEGQVEALIGIGLEQRTGLVLLDAQAEVIGIGAVTLLLPESAPLRAPGRGLIWPGLRMHRLTEGFVVDLERFEIEASPEGALLEVPSPERGPAPEGWSASGADPTHQERFAWAVEAAPFGTHAGAEAPLLPGSLALCEAQDSDQRGLRHEQLFAALYARPGAVGLLLGAQAGLEAVDGETLRIGGPNGEALGDSVLIVDSAQLSARALSPWPSNEDSGDGSLRAAALVDLRLHVLGWSEESGLAWDPSEGAPRSWP
ncbi:MAG: Type 1 glutamine amidotransferase-like domain-containing protein [Alphaproteobacteria bacterium]|nr:Type 1 glutamine amidotransferase-like domain-containing protein [Alphaproteobacteria bacterium]